MVQLWNWWNTKARLKLELFKYSKRVKSNTADLSGGGKTCFISAITDNDRGCQAAGEEERPASSGQEAQSKDENTGAAHREQLGLAAFRRRTKFVCGKWGNAVKITRNVWCACTVLSQAVMPSDAHWPWVKLS